MTKFPLLLAAATVFAPFAAAQNVAEELKALRERIDEIEDMQVDHSDRFGDRALVQAFSARNLDFGGHVTSLFTHIEGENGSDTGHLVSLIELFIKADLDDEWSLFASPGFYTFNGGLLDNPATATAGDPSFTADTATVENLFVSRIYGEWRPADAFHLQGGVVGSPHGTTNREYFIPARTIAANPLSSRVFLSNQLFPQYLRGVKATGKLAVGNTNWVEYDVYLGGESDNASDATYGGRVGYVLGDLGLTVAANAGRGTRQATNSPLTNFGLLQSPFPPSFNSTRDYEFAGLDVDWRSRDFIFKGEAYVSSEKGFADQRALSAETTYFVHPQWGISYRYDFYDAGGDLTNAAFGPQTVVDLGHSSEHVVGVSFNPHPSVRLRLDLHHNNLPNTSDTVQFINFSWSLSF
ncbi:MAG: hypothetical protein ACI89X_001234 [Planctomycetota bacterium]|jgi:hypothetical protein